MGVTNFDSIYVSGMVSSLGAPVIPDNYNGGTIRWVGSTITGASDNNDGTDRLNPCATIDGAIGKCVASVGDVIMVLPQHAETISVAGGIACDVAGITIVGLGNGANRPTVTWSATGSTWTISAANVTIRNIRTTSTIAAVVKLFNITAAHATLDTVDYYEDGSTDALQFVLTTTAADDITIKNCHWYRGTTAASALSQWVVLTGTDRAKILNNFCILKGFATSNPINSVLAVVTTACVGVEIVGNRFYDSNSTGNAALLMLAGTTGVLSDNRVGTSQGTLASAMVGASCFMFENYMTNEVAKGGVLEPAADAA